MVVAPKPEPIRLVGCAGHSRYFFGRGGSSEIWSSSSRDRHNSQTGPRSLDRAGLADHRCLHGQGIESSGKHRAQSKGEGPVVHLSFHRCLRAQHLCTTLHGTYLDLNKLGKAGLTATLFLIGTSLSNKTLQAVGIKPFLQGVILWIIVGSASLAAIYTGLISI